MLAHASNSIVGEGLNMHAGCEAGLPLGTGSRALSIGTVKTILPCLVLVCAGCTLRGPHRVVCGLANAAVPPGELRRGNACMRPAWTLHRGTLPVLNVWNA